MNKFLVTYLCLSLAVTWLAHWWRDHLPWYSHGHHSNNDKSTLICVNAMRIPGYIQIKNHCSASRFDTVTVNSHWFRYISFCSAAISLLTGILNSNSIDHELNPQMCDQYMITEVLVGTTGKIAVHWAYTIAQPYYYWWAAILVMSMTLSRPVVSWTTGLVMLQQETGTA